LLFFEKADKPRGKLLTKPFLSCLFILAACVQSPADRSYFLPILLGLIFCLGGDVFLIFPKTFLAGLISFLTGHIFYVWAFFSIAATSTWTWVFLGITIIAGVIVFLWLKTNLGSMKVPVLFYILVISLMVVGGGTVMGDTGINGKGRLLVFAGALLFYISDLFVARNRFLKKEFVNRLFGLPLYYSGQFLIAFSVAFI
jgi:uncharacterized membrane protein YhhN